MLGASYTFYSADINQIKNYYCTCEQTFKERYNNHASPFRNKSEEKKKISKEHSKYIWELKNNNKLWP